MAKVIRFTLEVSGNVSYSDGTKDVFMCSWDGKNVIDAFKTFTNNGFGRLYANKPSVVNATFAALTGTHTISPGAIKPTKTLTYLTLKVRGRVSYNNNKQADFQVSNSTLEGLSKVSGASDYHNILADSTQLANVRKTYTVLVGSGGSFTVTP